MNLAEHKPTKPEVVKELQDQIQDLRDSFSDAAGVIPEDEAGAKYSIACLEEAIAIITSTMEAQ